MKKEERLKTKINHEEVVDIDINASSLRILHGLREFDIPDGNDIYKISGLDRTFVKDWVKTTQGYYKFHRTRSQPALETLQKAGFEKKKLPSYPSITPVILKKYPVLEGWRTFNIRWSHLTFEENEAVIQTILALQRIEITLLPIYYSIFVPKSDASEAQFVLKSVLENRFGVSFKLGIIR